MKLNILTFSFFDFLFYIFHYLIIFTLKIYGLLFKCACAYIIQQFVIIVFL